MTSKPDGSEIKAELPVAPLVEMVPSVAGSISALASANAPFVYFDAVAFSAMTEGVCYLTLTSLRPMAAMSDRVVTGHLRASVVAMVRLRDDIDRMLLAAEPKPSGEMN